MNCISIFKQFHLKYSDNVSKSYFDSFQTAFFIWFVYNLAFKIQNSMIYMQSRWNLVFWFFIVFYQMEKSSNICIIFEIILSKVLYNLVKYFFQKSVNVLIIHLEKEIEQNNAMWRLIFFEQSLFPKRITYNVSYKVT